MNERRYYTYSTTAISRTPVGIIRGASLLSLSLLWQDLVSKEVAAAVVAVAAAAAYTGGPSALGG